jgi:MGT family glycosyltransferase
LATGGESSLPRPVPSNFIVRSSVPQVEILRRASAFITHGGMNSVQEALYYGVPMVLAPQGADQFWIATRAAELGAGVILDAARLQPARIRSAVASVLSGATYATAAARIAQSLHAAGGHTGAADVICGAGWSPALQFANPPQISNLPHRAGAIR